MSYVFGYNKKTALVSFAVGCSLGQMSYVFGFNKKNTSLRGRAICVA